MGKRFKTPVRPDRCRTEATQVGMGGCQAHDMNKVGVPLHDFEALRPVGADRPFRHHEDYSGHIPVSARNQNHYGKTFGTFALSFLALAGPRQRQRQDREQRLENVDSARLF
mmetsp:Transcript_167992/g.534338  ORF Transcript_167992/g.534338 Transcript_167992/m.534338 type:complete len:112 (+) Transcript_167992:137-472(+)